MRVAAAVVLSAMPLLAGTCPQAPVPSPDAKQDPPAEKPVGKLGEERGKVKVGDIATIDLPQGWGYLQQKQARHQVEQVWHNPPNPGVIGMVLPPDFEDSKWAIVVSYEKEGHVDDSDAAGINYDDLLKEMKSDAQAANAERRKQGYPTVELVGWAEPPHYDAVQKKLYWAKNLRFQGQPGTTLNYNVRVLGREGTLVMNAVAEMEQLPIVAAGSKDVLMRTEFVSGKRYGEFNSSIDKIAAYGIGGLIAGKVLLKTGILVKLFKPLIVVVVLVGGWLMRMLGLKKKQAPPAADAGTAQPGT